MKELIQQLGSISDAYDDFILGVINFARKDPAHIRLLNDYMRGNTDLKTSDVLAFIVNQPDFRDFSAAKEIRHVG